MIITDSAKSHLHPDTIRSLRKKSVVVAVIPTGCTMYLQALDTFIFSIFKKHYVDAAEEYIEQNGPRSKIKLTASQSRILCTRLTMVAWRRTVNTVDFKKGFEELGYTWVDESLVSPRTLPGYSFDPTTLNFPSAQTQEEKDEEENRIQTQAKSAEEEHKKLMGKNNKQTTLQHFWKK
jgi:hypothetical protein